MAVFLSRIRLNFENRKKHWEENSMRIISAVMAIIPPKSIEFSWISKQKVTNLNHSNKNWFECERVFDVLEEPHERTRNTIKFQRPRGTLIDFYRMNVSVVSLYEWICCKFSPCFSVFIFLQQYWRLPAPAIISTK